MGGNKPIGSGRVQLQYSRKYRSLCLCKGIEELGKIVRSILPVLRRKAVYPNFMIETQAAELYIGVCVWAQRIGYKFETDVVPAWKLLFQKIYVMHIS